MMQKPDYRKFFDSYAATMIEALDDDAGIETIQTAYAEEMIGAAPGGLVRATRNDEQLADQLRKNQDFYKSIGLQAMEVLDVEASAIDDLHDSVRVGFRATYRKPGGETISADFAVSYMLQKREEGPRIFAFVTGDEMALYRELGLIDTEGEPA